ncbi:protein kinase [Halobacteriovorax sp. HLS]|uniref:protein kinase domain-containing protein n=1 Tax=Halobacteriovorax sp. HLS TaxID=2234000 RepID=UPI000FDC13E1|nr:protein kinase [Halobacteriovorax sp. HLS]
MVSKIESFSLEKGRVLANRYTVLELLGAGVEGEVYKVSELLTNKVRALKIFFPHRNKNFKISTRNANKLDKLRESPIVMDYFSHDVIRMKGQKVACLACEFIEGELLGTFIEKQKLKKLGIFPSIHLLYSIVLGVESIHLEGEYHGDLHVDNIIIKRFGLEFDLKIIDLHHWGDSKKDNRDEDIVKIIRIFYDILGGAKYYKNLSPSLKYIICGLKRSIILNRFKTISDLRYHLELMDWSDAVR